MHPKDYWQVPSTAAELSVQEAAAGQVGLSIVSEFTNRDNSSQGPLKDIQVHVNLNRMHPVEAQAAYTPANGDEGLHGNRAGLRREVLLNLPAIYC